MPITLIEGEQRGDEGKGRFVDMLAEEHDIVARFNGGNNAGHTVVTPDGREFSLHSVPSGIAHDHVMNVIGNGTVINPASLTEEIAHIEGNDVEVGPHNLKISSAAHLILPLYVSEDEAREAGERAQGSTKKGIAQGYAAKSMRLGLRAESIKRDCDELLLTAYEGLRAHCAIRQELDLEPIDAKEVAKEYVAKARQLARFVTDTSFFLNQELNQGKRVLAEGAQAFLLDLDHGMYPFVTSSTTTAGGVATGLGVPPRIDRVVGVSKAIQSHVGGGPFVTEIKDPELLQDLHGDMSKIDAEKGTTTGRVRRLGHLDLVGIKRSHMINGTQEMAISKLDWVPRYGQEVPVCYAYERKGKILKVSPDAAYKLEESTPIYEYLPTWFEDISGVREFDELPKEAQNYIHFIEDTTGKPVTMIGVGPQRDQVIVRKP